VETLCLMYGVTPTLGAKGPCRSPEGEVIPPAEWANHEAPERFKASGIAELLHGLNDLLEKKRLDGGRP
jgi:hypothetical protein